MAPLLLALLLQAPPAASPMVEHTRAHTRLEKRVLSGERLTTPLGQILLPPHAKPGRPIPLVIHFHGAPWLAEQSVRRAFPKAAVLGVQLGSGSRVYGEPFKDPRTLQTILDALQRPVSALYLTGWSAGYGAIRQILRHPAYTPLIKGVLLIDGLHAGYQEPWDQRQPLPEDLAPFLDLGRRALRHEVRFTILHSEIFPGSYASTTESADYLLSQWGVARRPVLRWGPLGIQILSDSRRGRLRVLGLAGNSAPDHVDQLHALAWFFKTIK